MLTIEVKSFAGAGQVRIETLKHRTVCGWSPLVETACDLEVPWYESFRFEPINCPDCLRALGEL